MFDWLFEGHLLVYGLLAAAAVVFVVVWRRTRQRRWLAAAAGALALMGVYWLLDVAVETDRERCVRLVQEMADGLKPKADLGPVFDHVSDNFRSPTGKNKQEIRALAQGYLDAGTVTEVKVWNVRCQEASRDKGTAVVTFEGKAKGNLGAAGYPAMRCEATFEYDAARGWLLKAMEIHLEGVPDEAVPGY